MPYVWLGVDEQGLPVVLLECQLDVPPPPKVVLRNLSFDPLAECEIQNHATRQRAVVRAAVVRLTDSTPDLHVYFFRALESILSHTGHGQPLLSDVGDAIHHLIEIFRSLSLPPAISLQGLWAELLLIRHAANIQHAARAWHTTRRSLFDFEFGDQAIEVKSCASTHVRRHHFKQAQLECAEGRSVYVVSMLLEDDRSGPSVASLWRAVATRLPDAALGTRVAGVIADQVGRDWLHADSVRFNESKAVEQMLVLRAQDVPQMRVAPPPEVTDVEFMSDVSACPTVSRSDLVIADGLIAAIWPTVRAG